VTSRGKLPVLTRVVIALGLLLLAGTAAAFVTVRWTEQPQFCANCHVMKPMYESAFHSAHREVTCNDCHAPHDNLVERVIYKGISGTKDAYVYFLGEMPDVIETNARSHAIIDDNCKRCHTDLVAVVGPQPAGKRCFACHRHTPHGLR